MAIVQTGSILTFPALGDANAGTVSTTITVPADAEIVIVGWSSFSSSLNYFNTGSLTFTKGGVDTAMTFASDGTSVFNWSAPMFYLVLPDTGSNKTLKWDWNGAGTANDPNVLCSITFWKGIDTASPVRGTSGGTASTTPYTSGSVTALTGDLIVAWCAAFAASGEGSIDSWSNLTLLSQITHSGFADGAWATTSPTGNTIVAASTDTNCDDGSISALSLKPAPAAPFTGYVFSVGQSNMARPTQMIGY